MAEYPHIRSELVETEPGGPGLLKRTALLVDRLGCRSWLVVDLPEEGPACVHKSTQFHFRQES
jgi:hypothetical protein